MKPWRCLLGRHDDVLRVEPKRVYLECTSCLRETAGWDLHQVDDGDRARLQTMLRDRRKVVAV